jgi:hypothetical protein
LTRILPGDAQAGVPGLRSNSVLELFPGVSRYFVGRMGGTIAMRIKVLAAIAIVAFAAYTGLAVHPGSLPLEKQSTPAAAQLALAQSVDPFLLRSGG